MTFPSRQHDSFKLGCTEKGLVTDMILGSGTYVGVKSNAMLNEWYLHETSVIPTIGTVKPESHEAAGHRSFCLRLKIGKVVY